MNSKANFNLFHPINSFLISEIVFVYLSISFTIYSSFITVLKIINLERTYKISYVISNLVNRRVNLQLVSFKKIKSRKEFKYVKDQSLYSSLAS